MFSFFLLVDPYFRCDEAEIIDSCGWYLKQFDALQTALQIAFKL